MRGFIDHRDESRQFKGTSVVMGNAGMRNDHRGNAQDGRVHLEPSASEREEGSNYGRASETEGR